MPLVSLFVEQKRDRCYFMTETKKIALLGNPNCGKSSLFNQLTGLNQKVGNFAGVTTVRVSGRFFIHKDRYELVDLPGSYSLYSRSEDDQVLQRSLLREKFSALIVLVDANNLRRSLLLLLQVRELGLPVLVGLSMVDEAFRAGYKIDKEALASRLGLEVIAINARRGEGIIPMKEALLELISQQKEAGEPISQQRGAGELISQQKEAGEPISQQRGAGEPISQQRGAGELISQQKEAGEPISQQRGAGEPISQQRKAGEPFSAALTLVNDSLLRRIQADFRLPNTYWAYLYLQRSAALGLSTEDFSQLQAMAQKEGFSTLEAQREELRIRHQQADTILKGLLPPQSSSYYSYSERIDKVLTHRVYGSLVFLCVLLLIFQGVFAWSTPFMEAIDGSFAYLREEVSNILPQRAWSRLLTEGILTGMSGIAIFIPQIAFLFLVVGLLEESGYMGRVMTLTDRMMRRFGLNARSVIPLLSGMACAIPAVMATRGISQKKERLITILVVPLMTCSARLPVYTMLISLIVVDGGYWGPLNIQGLLLMGMYVLGTLSALGVAWLIHHLFPSKERSFLVMELPPYRWPLARNVLFTVYEKLRGFVWGAGKVILAISVVLWVLSSYGGEDRYEIDLQKEKASGHLLSAQGQASLRLEHSYMGQMGKQIEPLIAPLGYDWKIGIALIASFAAREVFVSVLAMVYSLGAEEEAIEQSLRAKLLDERNPETGEVVFNVAVCVSLLVFYAFAMQCMSTLAVVYRETRQLRWPFLQLLYMTLMAYGGAWLAYEVLS